MRNDELPLPAPPEAAVLHSYGLVRSDDLPSLASRWLAIGEPDTDAVAELAAHDPHDPWGVESLLGDIIAEGGGLPVGALITDHERILTEWVTQTWRVTGDTGWAVQTLASLGEKIPDFDYGLFIGYSDELAGGWGRLEKDLLKAARAELVHRLG